MALGKCSAANIGDDAAITVQGASCRAQAPRAGANRPPSGDHVTKPASSRSSTRTPPLPIPNGLITSAPSFGSPVLLTLARPLPAFGRRPARSRISSASSCCPPPSALRRSAITGRSKIAPDGSFREDASRIRCNPGIFARLRSFASNILRFNGVENVCDTRYRITLGGVDALCSLRFIATFRKFTINCHSSPRGTPLRNHQAFLIWVKHSKAAHTNISMNSGIPPPADRQGFQKIGAERLKRRARS